jgi:hypothetical protein
MGIYDIDNIDYMPVHLNYNDFLSLNKGINPTSKKEVTDNIKRGKKYIVDLDGLKHNLGFDEEENLILLPHVQ